MNSNGIFKKIAQWSWTGLIGIAIGALGLYIAWFNGAAVSYSIVNSSNIVDVKKSVNGLNITFENKDIVKENLSLRSYRVLVRNTGHQGILTDYFDGRAPWGILVSDGAVINVAIAQASSDYLRGAVSPSVIGSNKIIFPPIIFDQGASFSIDFLVLHSTAMPPALSPIGKIAGVENITIRDNADSNLHQSIWDDLIAGGIWANLLKVAISPIIGIIFILFIVFVLAYPISQLSTAVRRYRISKVLGKSSLREGKVFEVIRDTYAEGGGFRLRRIAELMEVAAGRRKDRQLSRSIQRSLYPVKEIGEGATEAKSGASSSSSANLPARRFLPDDLVLQLIGCGLIERGEGGGAKIDEAALEVIKQTLIVLSIPLENPVSAADAAL